MSKASAHPRVRLSKLRDIGWTLWDPIGLLPPNARWDEDQYECFVDEYDNYLTYAASHLRDGTEAEAVVAYLEKVEADHMGLGYRQTTRARAEAVVAAIIASADGIWVWPDEQGRFSS